MLHHCVGMTARTPRLLDERLEGLESLERGGGGGGGRGGTLQSVDEVIGSVKDLDEGTAVAALGHLLSIPQHITCSQTTLSRVHHTHMALGRHACCWPSSIPGDKISSIGMHYHSSNSSKAQHCKAGSPAGQPQADTDTHDAMA